MLPLRLLLIALALNFAWEMLQMPAFTGLPESALAATGSCVLAALGDVAIVLAMYGLGAARFHDVRWYRPPRAHRYAMIVTVGVLLHLLIEWVAVHRLARWGYSEIQPIVPGVDVGLLPILQPIILLPLTFWLVARVTEPRPDDRGLRSEMRPR